MPRTLGNKIGETFGKLTVIDQKLQTYADGFRRTALLCTCACGSGEEWYRSNDVIGGKTTSCGCNFIAAVKKGTRKRGGLNG